MKQHLLISLAGLDGCGKTTQARRLVETLSGEGLATRYVWNYFQPRLLAPAIWAVKGTLLRGHQPQADYEAYRQARRSLYRHRLLSRAYRYSILSEYVLWTALTVAVPRLRYRATVCDRYAYDVVAGITADSTESAEEAEALLRWCFRFLPQPDVAFLIDLPEEEASPRKDDVLSRGEQQAKRGIYLALAALPQTGMTVLDGRRSVDELAQEIAGRVLELAP